MKLRGLTFIAMIWVLSTTLQAEIIKKAQVGFRFLENPVGAASIGRGAMGVTLESGANAVFWNPAGVSWSEQGRNLMLTRTQGIADIELNAMAASVKFMRDIYLAADLISMDYGQLNGTRRADNEDGFIETGSFSPSAWAAGVTLSQRVSTSFSYGVRLKYAHQDLGSAWISTSGVSLSDSALVLEQKSYALSDPAIDIGTSYRFPVYDIRFGAVIRNFSRELKYERQKFPMPFAVSFSLSADLFKLLKLDRNKQELLLGFETIHPRDYREKFILGAEYNMLEVLALRMGYMGNYDERGLTFGTGFTKQIGALHLKLDYAFQSHGVFEPVHTFSFSTDF